MTAFIAFVKAYYLEIMIVLACSFGLFEHMEILQKKAIISVLDAKIETLSNSINTQNSAIIANKADYTEKLKQLPKENEKIVTKYQTVFKTIEVIKEKKDENCSDAINDLNSFSY